MSKQKTKEASLPTRGSYQHVGHCHQTVRIMERQRTKELFKSYSQDV